MELKIAYRLPQEFIWYRWNIFHAIRVWFIYAWYEDYNFLGKEWGFRFLGIEIVIQNWR